MRSFRAVSPDSKWKVSEGTAVFLSGGLGSNLFWIGSFPFDAVKKCVFILFTRCLQPLADAV